MAFTKKYRQIPEKLIDIHKKVPGEDEEKTINLALVSLRKQYLSTSEGQDRFKNKILHFNKVVKSKPFPLLINAIKYWLRH